jgi:hypothetical protein
MNSMTKKVDAAGNGTTATWPANGQDRVCVAGTFDSATVTIQASPDSGTTWVQVSDDTAFTAAAWYAMDLPIGVLLRAVISGGGDGTAIDIHVS